MVRRKRRWWLSQPSVAFHRDPLFYNKYDAVWTVLGLGLSATLLTLGWRGFDVPLAVASLPLLLGMLAVACYFQVMAGVFIHNCAHQNFPRAINRLVGEAMGAIVCTRYASWEILHCYHHAHSDHRALDPHPADPGFWGFFVRRMVMGLEKNLTHQYLERWGDSPANRRRDRRRTMGSWIGGLTLVATWLVICGPVVFFCVFLPALFFGAVHVSHFNWVTHNASAEVIDGEEPDYRPTNLDSGVYWLANRVLFGLYMHANHHAYVKYFNPLNVPADKAERAAAKISKHRVKLGLPA